MKVRRTHLTYAEVSRLMWEVKATPPPACIEDYNKRKDGAESARGTCVRGAESLQSGGSGQIDSRPL